MVIFALEGIDNINLLAWVPIYPAVLEAHAHSSMQLIPSQNHDFPIRKL